MHSRADALDPGVLDFVDLGRIERRVVEQNLDAIGSRADEAADGPDVEQIGQTAGARVVVAAVFVGEQQAGVLRASARGGQTVFGIEQDGAGVRREDARDGGLEFLEHLRGDVLLVDALSLAMALLSEPRWSMAAAAITPRESDTAFSPFCFPGVIFMVRPLERSRSIRGILAREVKI